jgi:hypothetical protein
MCGVWGTTTNLYKSRRSVVDAAVGNSIRRPVPRQRSFFFKKKYISEIANHITLFLIIIICLQLADRKKPENRRSCVEHWSINRGDTVWCLKRCAGCTDDNHRLQNREKNNDSQHRSGRAFFAMKRKNYFVLEFCDRYYEYKQPVTCSDQHSKNKTAKINKR